VDDPLEEKGLGIHYDFEKITGTNYNKEWSEDRKFAMNLYKEHQGKIFTVIDAAQRLWVSGLPLLLDCHSFSERDNVLCPNAHEYKEIDICIGFNEDDTKPSEEFINSIKNFFTACGYRVECNVPFSNSKTIQYCECDAFKYADKDYVNTFLNYHSIMIEVNKHCYMNEETLEVTDGYYKLHRELQELYAALLKG
jgi:N-formylglutamate amidohydrolase